uniref:GlimmerM protein 62 n=1 Tax=Beta vulgaris TaxID=161934 RepID=Q20CE2_BETVU|nr:GlimmerM protein 62 [Beta vulgaris]
MISENTLSCCRRGKLAKILLSLTVSVFTSVCLYGLPFLVSCTKCDSSLSNSECSTTGRTGNYKNDIMQFNLLTKTKHEI